MPELHINYEKSVLIPIHYDEGWVNEVKNVLGCMVTPLPISYLGIPLGSNPKPVDIWRPIIDKTKRRLSGWKAKLLSKASKTVLIKSMINNLPIYYLGLFRMPKYVAREIIAIQRRFF